MSTKEAKSLVTEDNRFFDLLQPTDIKQHRVTLQQILDNRIDWLKAQGQQHISNYKTQLLAKKLTELGFRRTRTAKGNWWNVLLPVITEEFGLNPSGSPAAETTNISPTPQK